MAHGMLVFQLRPAAHRLNFLYSRVRARAHPKFSGDAIVSLERYRNKILAQFGLRDVITYSLGQFNGDLAALQRDVAEWWRLYKAWEQDDTIARAYAEQRLTVKGTAMTWTQDLQADDTGAKKVYPMPKKDTTGLTGVKLMRVQAENRETKHYPIEKGLLGIVKRLNPEAFMPASGGASQKTELGLHDLSAGLMNREKPISAQQYKTPDKDTYYVFMPLSHPGDQAVFQNINMLAKAFRDAQPELYGLVRDIRSKMTRIKLAAEHDMATCFARVGTTSAGRPRFKFTLGAATDVSIRDRQRGVLPPDFVFDEGRNVKNVPTPAGILEARRSAALNFHSLILGEIHSYGEVTVAYRQHAGGFPKFAQFDSASQSWKVGRPVRGSWVLNAPSETIADRPA